MDGLEHELVTRDLAGGRGYRRPLICSLGGRCPGYRQVLGIDRQLSGDHTRRSRFLQRLQKRQRTVDID